MSIRFVCPECGHRLKADDAAAGSRARCSKCGTVVAIPSETEPTRRGGGAEEDLNVRGGHAGGERQGEASGAGEGAPWVIRRRAPMSDDEIDMTPMIDVVFQLLIFFMVTAAFALQKSLPVPVPETTSDVPQASAPNDQDAVTVRIDADDLLWVDGTQAASRQDLIAKLRKLRAGGRRTLLVSADPESRHESVVTALDAGSAAGMEEVELVTDTEE